MICCIWHDTVSSDWLFTFAGTKRRRRQKATDNPWLPGGASFPTHPGPAIGFTGGYTVVRCTCRVLRGSPIVRWKFGSTYKLQVLRNLVSYSRGSPVVHCTSPPRGFPRWHSFPFIIVVFFKTLEVWRTCLLVVVMMPFCCLSHHVVVVIIPLEFQCKELLGGFRVISGYLYGGLRRVLMETNLVEYL